MVTYSWLLIYNFGDKNVTVPLKKKKQMTEIYFYLKYEYNHYISNFFFIIRVKARAIPCPHQPPIRGDNTVLVAQGVTATPGATKQLLPLDKVLRESYIYIYIYIYNILVHYHRYFLSKIFRTSTKKRNTMMNKNGVIFSSTMVH